MDNHHSKKEIDDLIFEILKSSKSLDVFPTPVDKIVEYCELNLSNKNGFHHIPSNYIPKKIDAFNRMLKKVLGAFDREEKVIYIDPSLPHVKQNFIKLHETGHGAIPWQKEIKYEDNEYTLSPAVKEVFEAEANYFASAGCLLVLEDKNGSKNTLDLRNSFQSTPFTKEFGELTWPKLFNSDFPFILDYTRKRQFHKDGTIQLLIHGEFTEFSYHYFNNRYNVFVLIIPVGEKNKSRTKIYLTS